jgi:hypothetical protein
MKDKVTLELMGRMKGIPPGWAEPNADFGLRI